PLGGAETPRHIVDRRRVVALLHETMRGAFDDLDLAPRLVALAPGRRCSVGFGFCPVHRSLRLGADEHSFLPVATARRNGRRRPTPRATRSKVNLLPARKSR